MTGRPQPWHGSPAAACSRVRYISCSRHSRRRASPRRARASSLRAFVISRLSARAAFCSSVSGMRVLQWLAIVPHIGPLMRSTNLRFKNVCRVQRGDALSLAGHAASELKVKSCRKSPSESVPMNSSSFFVAPGRSSLGSLPTTVLKACSSRRCPPRYSLAMLSHGLLLGNRRASSWNAGASTTAIASTAGKSETRHEGLRRDSAVRA